MWPLLSYDTNMVGAGLDDRFRPLPLTKCVMLLPFVTPFLVSVVDALTVTFVVERPNPPFCSRRRCRVARRSKLANRYDPPIPSYLVLSIHCLVSNRIDRRKGSSAERQGLIDVPICAFQFRSFRRVFGTTCLVRLLARRDKLSPRRGRNLNRTYRRRGVMITTTRRGVMGTQTFNELNRNHETNENKYEKERNRNETEWERHRVHSDIND